MSYQYFHSNFKPVARGHLLALLTLSTLLCQLAPAQLQSQLQSGPGFIHTEIPDAYPSRVRLWQKARELCLDLGGQSKASQAEVARLVAHHLLMIPGSVEVSTDSSGWTAELQLVGTPGGYLRLMKNGSSFMVDYRQSRSTIEAIANISISDSCQKWGDTKLTYYNSEMRPVLRVKLDSQWHQSQAVIMEEAVHESQISQAAVLSSQKAVRIGIIDSGIDYNHQSLLKKSRPMLGIDLTNKHRPPYDYTNTIQNELMGRHFSHGTAVADIASRDLEVLIVPVRTENQSQLDGAAVEYLAQQKVRIVNISQGTARVVEWQALKSAIKKHPEMLFIVSAGNESQDIDLDPVYPAGFELPNMLVVASVDHEGHLSEFSNFGSEHVHLAARGEKVTAALAGGGEWTVSGTSFSAPLVANRAAKLLLDEPKLSAQQLRERLIHLARPSEELKDKVRYGIID